MGFNLGFKGLMLFMGAVAVSCQWYDAQHFKSLRLEVVPASTQLTIIHKPPIL